VLDSSAPSVSASLVPGAPDGANGWFHTNVALSWNVADADSPLSSQSGCESQNVATDGAVTFTCSATSVGGTTSQPVTIMRDTVPPGTPTFTGVNAGETFRPRVVPSASSIGCTSSDATSGLASCVVTGFSAALGRHTLTATATDVSGLTSTSTLNYRVAAVGASRPAFSRRQTIGSVLRNGLKLSVTVGADQTRLDATVKVGRTTCMRQKSTRRAGKTTLALKARRACRQRLRRARRAKFALTLKASGANVTNRTLRKSVTLKR
jgi:hypothetical protein